MKKALRKITAIILVTVITVSMTVQNISANSWIFNSSGWRVRLDTPTPSKPYHHLHFYKGNKNIYCLRLDNMQPCDGTDKNSQKVPRWIKEKVMRSQRVKNAVAYHNPVITSPRIRTILKPLLVAGAAVAVVVSAVNIFTGPIDDFAAWAALSATLSI